MRCSKGLVIVILCAVFILTGCQPTPEKTIIAQKGHEEKIYEQAQASANNYSGSAEKENWEETKTVEVQGQKATVTARINAALPEISANIPVIRIEPDDFDLEFAQKAADYFLGDLELYAYGDSKADVSQAKLLFEYEIAKYQDKLDNDRAVRGIQNYRDFLDERYKSSKDENKPADLAFVNDPDGGEVISLKVYPDTENILKFNIKNNGNFTRFDLDKYDYYLTSIIPRSDDIDETINANGCQLSAADAKKIADDVVNQVFQTDSRSFMLKSIRLTDFKNIIDDYVLDPVDYFSVESETQGYLFIYTRKYDESIPTLVLDGATFIESEDIETQYREPYFQEFACIIIGDDGVMSASYSSPSNILETINENVSILSLEEVLEIFKKNIFYFTYWGEGKTIININKIEFGLIRVPVKDNTQQYMMVPAFNFVGENNSSMIGFDFSENNKSIMLINAIDGTIISDIRNILDY